MNQEDPRPPCVCVTAPRLRQNSGSNSDSSAPRGRLPRQAGSDSMAPVAVAMRRPPFVIRFYYYLKDGHKIHPAVAAGMSAATLGNWRYLPRLGGASSLPIRVAANQGDNEQPQARSEVDDGDSP